MKHIRTLTYTRWICGLILFAFLMGPDSAGTDTIRIEGKVHKIQGDQKRKIRGAYVFLVGVPESVSYSSSKKKRVIDQVNQTFTPHILPVSPEQPVIFKNSDPVNHNVRLTRTKNEELLMNKMTYPGRSVSYTFRNDGVISVQCDIHPSMQAYIPVLEEPFLLSRSDEQGKFTFTLPDSLVTRDFRIMAWDQEIGWSDTAHVTVTSDGIKKPLTLSFN